MPGTFTVHIIPPDQFARSKKTAAAASVFLEVRVTSVNNFKGSVSMKYTHDIANPPPPDLLVPTQENLLVPKGGSISSIVQVDWSGEVVITAKGTDGSTSPPITSSDSILLDSSALKLI